MPDLPTIVSRFICDTPQGISHDTLVRRLHIDHPTLKFAHRDLREVLRKLERDGHAYLGSNNRWYAI